MVISKRNANTRKQPIVSIHEYSIDLYMIQGAETSGKAARVVVDSSLPASFSATNDQEHLGR